MGWIQQQMNLDVNPEDILAYMIPHAQLVSQYYSGLFTGPIFPLDRRCQSLSTAGRCLGPLMQVKLGSIQNRGGWGGGHCQLFDWQRRQNLARPLEHGTE